MKIFKTALRSRLAIRFVSAMMAVKLNTPEEGEFDPVPFIHSCWNKKVRRIGGDGKRKRKPEQHQQLSDSETESCEVN